MGLYKVSYHVGNMLKSDYEYLFANNRNDAFQKTSLNPILFDWEKPFLRWDCREESLH